MKSINKLFIAMAICLLFIKAEAKTLENSMPKLDTLPTNELTAYLQQMNIESYYGKPVDSFLLAVPANLYNMKVYGGSNNHGSIFRASEMIADFTPVRGGGPSVIIYVREFNFLNRYSPNATWDVNLFRKEKIHRIDVYANQNTCINGGCLN